MTRNDELTGLAAEIVAAAAAKNLLLRICGGVAVWLHCPATRHWLRRLDRTVRDLDFVAPLGDKYEVERLFERDFDFRSDPRLAAVPESRRSILHRYEGRRLTLSCDVNYGGMDYCHFIDLHGRLAADSPTIPLAELLLSKLQIHQLTRKDVVDVAALLGEHPLGDSDQETVRRSVPVRRCASSWGLWKTATDNLGRIRAELSELDPPPVTRLAVLDRIDELERSWSAAGKTFRWRIGGLWSRLFPGRRWYRQVDDLAPPVDVGGTT